MKQIAVRSIIAITLIWLVAGCSSVKPDPNTGPNTEQGQERERLNRMLNPSPNRMNLTSNLGPIWRIEVMT